MAKKVTPKAAVSPNAPAPAAKGGPRPATKGALLAALSEQTGLGKQQIAGVFDALAALIARDLGKKGPGQFVVPGLFKLKVVRKPATRAKQGVNPFTRAPMMIKAKPARNVVKAIPMKALKELV